jgi:alpha-tubulin suppressor-like RCC1 family protein
MRTFRKSSGLAALLASVSPLLSAADLRPAAGGYHALALDGGTVLGFGERSFGQLGSILAGAPSRIPGLGGVTQVAAGRFSTIVLKSDGTVWFLGDFTVQHVTAHGTPNAVTVPTQVAGLSNIVSIAAGARHFLALDSQGNAFAWGHNGNGQIGNDNNRDISTPALVLTNVRMLSAGDGFSAAVKLNGEVWTWGCNSHGQLGLGDTAERHVPASITGISNAAACSAGGRHLLVLKSDGTVLACGANDFGQLGTGGNGPSLTPVAVTLPGTATALAAGAHHSAAVVIGGGAFLWGRNYEGQCGGGSASSVTVSTPAAITLGQAALRIACGWNFTLFELPDHSLWGIGSDSDGQLGGASEADETSSAKVLDPQLILTLPDSDNDGLSDSLEGAADVDGDGLANSLDTDSDGDGVPDSVEETTDRDLDGTNDYLDPFTDGDHDKMDDNWELHHMTTLSRDGRGDLDADGLADFFESLSGSHPADSSSVTAVLTSDGRVDSMATLSLKVRKPLVLGLDFDLQRSGALLDWTRMTTSEYEILSTLPDGNTASLLKIGVPFSTGGNFFRLAR